MDGVRRTRMRVVAMVCVMTAIARESNTYGQSVSAHFEHYTGIIISLPTSWMMRFFDVRRWWLNIGCNKSLVHYTESSTTQDGLT